MRESSEFLLKFHSNSTINLDKTPVISTKANVPEKETATLEKIISFQQNEILSLREELANQELLSLTSVFSQSNVNVGVGLDFTIKPAPIKNKKSIHDHERENIHLAKRNAKLEHSVRFWTRLNSLNSKEVVELIESLKEREQRLVNLIEFYQSQIHSGTCK